MDDIGDISEFEKPLYWKNKVLEYLKIQDASIYFNPETGLYDVDGAVHLYGYGLESFGISFGTVTGFFDCSFNRLTSLEGAPKRVDGSFYCSDNQLITLKGAPERVEGSFRCDKNQLTTLEGSPVWVGGEFVCRSSGLTSLKGAPRYVGSYFSCSGNSIISLKGAPERVEGNFYCNNNQLISLEGAPARIDGDFQCENNPDLNELGNIYDRVRGKVYIGNIGSVEEASAIFKKSKVLQESTDDEFGDVSEFEEPTYWTNRVLTFLKEKKIEYTIDPKTKRYNIIGSVDLSCCSLESFGDVRFGKVTGNFDCSFNKLTSLEGAPLQVGGSFYCECNNLSSLHYSPSFVFRDFWCFGNRIITLEGSPRKIEHGEFDCSDNSLITLEGAPKYVGGDFNCENNNLISLKGIPQFIGKTFFSRNNPLIIYREIRDMNNNNTAFQESVDDEFGDVSEFEKPIYWTNRILELLKEKGVRYTINSKTGLYDVDGNVDLRKCNLESFGDVKFGSVKGSFDCAHNNLKSLEGCPRKVQSFFDCSNNQISVLNYTPLEVGGDFFCGDNLLTSLKGSPKYVGGSFYCYDNHLITLEGSPEYIPRTFACMGNKLTSLKGAPNYIGENLNCQNNPLIITLKDIDKQRIKGTIYADSYDLKEGRNNE